MLAYGSGSMASRVAASLVSHLTVVNGKSMSDMLHVTLCETIRCYEDTAVRYTNVNSFFSDYQLLHFV